MIHQSARYRQHPIPLQAFGTPALRLAERLPQKAFLINLCQDRCFFTLGLIAAAWRRQTVLLPPAQSPALLEDLQRQFSDNFILTDDWIRKKTASAGCGATGRENLSGQEILRSLQLLAFTSGSTGKPQAWPRNGEMLQYCAKRALLALDLHRQRHAMIATTPPQHMYGLETSVIWPLCSRLVLTNQRPFYPEDIRRAIAQSRRSVVLVSTPLHLKACLDSPGAWHNIAAILSSTAPLDPEIASELERATGAPVVELYGSTETLSFAWRRPTQDPHWHTYAGVKLSCRDDLTVLTAPWLDEPVELPDLFLPIDERRFQSLGRQSDLIKIAGKRQSLTELNRLLLSIDGVNDGCFYLTDHGRVGAVVVTQRGRGEIRQALRRHVDPVFLPRPLYFVATIPRNETGKIVRSELNALLESLSHRS